MTAPVHMAQYGTKSRCPELSMLAANVARASNKAAATTIALCLGALDVGVPAETVLRVPEMLTSIIRAYAKLPATGRRGKTLHRAETAIEGRINDLQVKYLCGEATTADKIELRREIKRIKHVLAEIDADLEREINETILPKDDSTGGMHS